MNDMPTLEQVKREHRPRTEEEVVRALATDPEAGSCSRCSLRRTCYRAVYDIPYIVLPSSSYCSTHGRTCLGWALRATDYVEVPI